MLDSMVPACSQRSAAYFMSFGHAQADQSAEHGVDARAFGMVAPQQSHILFGSLFEPLGDLSPDTE
jgi:hypothetical protein